MIDHHTAPPLLARAFPPPFCSIRPTAYDVSKWARWPLSDSPRSRNGIDETSAHAQTGRKEPRNDRPETDPTIGSRATQYAGSRRTSRDLGSQREKRTAVRLRTGAGQNRRCNPAEEIQTPEICALGICEKAVWPPVTGGPSWKPGRNAIWEDSEIPPSSGRPVRPSTTCNPIPCRLRSTAAAHHVRR